MGTGRRWWCILGAMTPKQAAFVGFYLGQAKGNATKAALLAGYSKKTARVIGGENLLKPAIADAIAERQANLSAELELTQENIARELALIGFSNMLDYVRITADGEPYVDLTELTRDQAAALSEATVDDFVDGRGDDAREVRRVRIKLGDKRHALMDLARLLGLEAPRQLEVTGQHGGPIEVRDAETSPLAALSSELLRGIRKELRARAR
jgi:phage terminase small subunit